jgi:dTDP-glucose pyrophosphorylase
MAAGLGSRYGGNKQDDKIGPDGEILMQYSIYDAIKAGFTKVVFIIKPQYLELINEISNDARAHGIKIEIVYQDFSSIPDFYKIPEERVKPFGTVHAVLSAKNVVNEPFAVINADDFYGASAFSKVSEGLSSGDNYCMVGFKLINTVTENGYVSRGVCSVENGFLTDVDEHTKIDSDCKFTKEDGSVGQLSPDTVVSMNMWGFTPDIFGYLESNFVEFLNEKITVPKSEFFLPTVVDKLIKNGTKKVKVLVAEDKWYGVTYKEDLQGVVSAIKALCDEGKYSF